MARLQKKENIQTDTETSRETNRQPDLVQKTVAGRRGRGLHKNVIELSYITMLSRERAKVCRFFKGRDEWREMRLPRGL